MKRFALLVLLVLPFIGCKTVTTPQPLAPGYANQADQSMGEVLAGAHAFYARLQGDIASGAYVPAPTEKTSLNNFGKAINVAQTAYLAFHAGTGTEAAAQSAVNTVKQQQTALQASVGGK